MIGIYKFTNKINNKSYIGQSVNIANRVQDHFYRAFYNYHTNREYDKAFYRALRKYGKENFNFEILEECSKEDLNEREKYWIKYYNSYENGYNETIGGDYDIMPHDGENHPRHKLLEKEVFDIRERYKNHEFKDNVYALYKDKIGKSGFNKVWNGFTWTNVHMDVYTDENVAFHTLVRNSHPGKGTGKRLTVDEIKDIRQRIKNESEDEVYKDYKDKVGSRQIFTNICRYRTYKYITV
jgi:group I intron endonuclease